MEITIKMYKDEYEEMREERDELIRRAKLAETQLTTFCDMLLERAAWIGPVSGVLRYDGDFITQMLEEYGYDVKGRIEELNREDEKSLEPIIIPEGVDDDLPFV